MAVNYGSKRVVVGAHYGFRDWLSQRVTAVMRAYHHALGPIVDSHVCVAFFFSGLSRAQNSPNSLAPSATVSTMLITKVATADEWPCCLLTLWVASIHRWRTPATAWCR